MIISQCIHTCQDKLVEIVFISSTYSHVVLLILIINYYFSESLCEDTTDRCRYYCKLNHHHWYDHLSCQHIIHFML